MLSACNPEAQWTDENVEISIAVEAISAGFIECSFSTNKDAYYLISIDRAQEGVNPMDHQKTFMTLALDSANLAYLTWRNQLLKDGETTIAPFASHTLQYGDVKQFFTTLEAKTDYWIYAFVVNPKTLQPAGKLYLVTVQTTDSSTVDVHFEYRVWGRWDYVYPVDSTGAIYGRYPYLIATRDSALLERAYQQDPVEYFGLYFLNIMEHPNWIDHLSYGVNVQENNGLDSDVEFEEGHTYYTAIVGWDGNMGNNVIYKFTWTGDDFEAYFKDEDSIINDREDE